jgi:hypothetical protein
VINLKITMSHGGVTQEGDEPHTKIVRVDNRETSECKDCGIDQDCDDTISWEPLEFPAYKSMGTGNCYNDATVRGHIKSHRAGVKPRDPVSRAVWDLPSELLGVQHGNDGRNTTQNDTETDAERFANVHFPRIMHLKRVGSDNMARQLFYTTKRFAQFDVSIIVTMFQIGMEPEARDLYHFTKRNRLKNYQVSKVAWLYEIGMRAEACDLHMLSVSSYHRSWATDPLMDPLWFPTYSAPDVIKLFEMGMEDQALDLHKRSVQFADEYSTDDIISLAEAGMKDQAMTLHIQTMDNIMGMSNGLIVDAIVALTNSTARLKPLAEELLVRG